MNENVIKEELTNKITDVNCFYITDEDIGYSDRYSMSKKIAEHLYEAGYRKQEDTVKEFAEKLLSPLIKAYNQSYKASGYDMEAAISANEIKHYIDHIKQTAEQYGKEEV